MLMFIIDGSLSWQTAAPWHYATYLNFASTFYKSFPTLFTVCFIVDLLNSWFVLIVATFAFYFFLHQY